MDRDGDGTETTMVLWSSPCRREYTSGSSSPSVAHVHDWKAVPTPEGFTANAIDTLNLSLPHFKENPQFDDDRLPGTKKARTSGSKKSSLKSTDPASFCNCTVIEWPETELINDRERLHSPLIEKLLEIVTVDLKPFVIDTEITSEGEMYAPLRTIYKNSINAIASRLKLNGEFLINSTKDIDMVISCKSDSGYYIASGVKIKPNWFHFEDSLIADYDLEVVRKGVKKPLSEENILSGNHTQKLVHQVIPYMVKNEIRYAGMSTIEKNYLLKLEFHKGSNKMTLKVSSSFSRTNALKNVHWMLMLYCQEENAKLSEEEVDSMELCVQPLKAEPKTGGDIGTSGKPSEPAATTSSSSSSSGNVVGASNSTSSAKGLESTASFSLVGLPLIANHGQSVWKATVESEKGSPIRVTFKNDKAIPMIVKLSNCGSDSAMAYAYNESMILEYLGFHNNFSTEVVAIQEVIIQDIEYHSILMIYSGPSLASISSESLSKYKASTKEALSKLHAKGVTHGDVRLENFVIDDKNKNIRVIDFELSTKWSLDQEAFQIEAKYEMNELESLFD